MINLNTLEVGQHIRYIGETYTWLTFNKTYKIEKIISTTGYPVVMGDDGATIVVDVIANWENLK